MTRRYDPVERIWYEDHEPIALDLPRDALGRYWATGSTDPVHWIGDAPTALHGNGAASFGRTSRDAGEVTCRLCLTLLDRERRRAQDHADGSGA